MTRDPVGSEKPVVRRGATPEQGLEALAEHDRLRAERAGEGRDFSSVRAGEPTPDEVDEEREAAHRNACPYELNSARHDAEVFDAGFAAALDAARREGTPNHRQAKPNLGDAARQPKGEQ